jgi:hypothetical protein
MLIGSTSVKRQRSSYFDPLPLTGEIVVAALLQLENAFTAHIALLKWLVYCAPLLSGSDEVGIINLSLSTY